MINTVKHLCYVLRIREGQLASVLSEVGEFYYERVSQKMKYGEPQINHDGSIKTRTLHPSTGKLKNIQQRINQNILSRLPVPLYAFGSVKDTNNIDNARRHLGNKFFLSIDLKSYFSSVTNKMVFQAFRSYHFSPTVARILTQLTTHNGCLPQGAPTSPLIANLVFASTGSKILDLINGRDITFTTFLDDFSFSSKLDFKDLVMPILSILKADGYWIRHDKISYKRKSPEITGIIIESGQLMPHNRVLKRLNETNSPHLKRYVKRVMSS